MPEATNRTKGSRELDKILVEEGRLARAIKREFHRSVLWRYRTGRRLPELDGAVLIAKLTKRRIPEAYWLIPVGK